MFFHKVENLKNWCYESNYRRLTIFEKTLHCRCLAGFWICQGSEYTRVLNMPRFSIYHGSEYGFGSVYTRVLNMPRLQRVLKMPMSAYAKYVWMYQNMREYTVICLNGFYFKFLHYNPFRLFSWRDKIWFFRE